MMGRGARLIVEEVYGPATPPSFGVDEGANTAKLTAAIMAACTRLRMP